MSRAVGIYDGSWIYCLKCSKGMTGERVTVDDVESGELCRRCYRSLTVRPVYVHGPKHLRYLAGCADSWEVSRSKRRGYMGERVIVMRWVDSGKVELRHCKGDGRNIVGGFTTYLHTNEFDVDMALITARQIMEREAESLGYTAGVGS